MNTVYTVEMKNCIYVDKRNDYDEIIIRFFCLIWYIFISVFYMVGNSQMMKFQFRTWSFSCFMFILTIVGLHKFNLTAYKVSSFCG